MQNCFMEKKDYPRTMCYQCYRPTVACFCHLASPFKTNFHFRILMHPMEAKKEPIGTGRLTNYSLKNSKLIIDKDFDDNKEVQAILNDSAFFPILLYPGENSININECPVPQHYYSQKTPIIFVIDGTWHCAKSMMRDSRSLHHLPRISFNPCLLYTSPSPRDATLSRMPSSA